MKNAKWTNMKRKHHKRWRHVKRWQHIKSIRGCGITREQKAERRTGGGGTHPEDERLRHHERWMRCNERQHDNQLGRQETD